MESEVTQSAFFLELWKKADAHKKQIQWGIIAAVVVGLAVGLYFWQQDRKQQAANSALSKAAGHGPAQPASVDALMKVAGDYSGTEAAGRALLFAGVKLFDDGKYVEAKNQFDTFLRQYSDSKFASQALYGTAACLSAQGKTNEAIAAFKDIVDHRSTENVAMLAKLSLARLYDTSGKPELARDLYKDLARPDYGTIGSEAIMYLEELISKHPNLMPTPTPAPVPPVSTGSSNSSLLLK